MAAWVVTCSCGWTSEFSQRWAAESAAKLHPKLGASGTEHTITVAEPLADSPGGDLLPLISRGTLRAPGGQPTHPGIRAKGR